MPKLTQKDLQAAMQPLRRAIERYGLDLCNGWKHNADTMALVRDGIEWHGYTIKATLIQKSRVSCGVPAPYHLFQIRYSGFHADGSPVVQGWEAGSFRPMFLRQIAREEAAGYHMVTA